MAMASIMVIDLTGHCIAVRRDLLRKRGEKEEQYRDIEPLVHYVGALIGGYVFVQDAEWPLSMYDHSDDVIRSYAKMAEGQSAAGDTKERRWEFQFRSIEMWGRKEIGLYINAVRKEQEGIFFPVHTEREIQIIYCGKEGERMVDAAKERDSFYEKGVFICRTYTPCSDRTGY